MNDRRRQTIRQQIIHCLETMPMTARDISKSVRISEKDVAFHLEFIEKTIRHTHKILDITPCACLNCGFEFSRRKKFKKPGKCPGCRKPRIVPAVFRLIDSPH